MSLPHISPEEAKRLMAAGAVLADIREPGEHARERIPGAKSVPVAAFRKRDSRSSLGK